MDSSLRPSQIEGLQFWVQSPCRSTLKCFEEIARSFGVPFRVCAVSLRNNGRQSLGFSVSEFSHLDIIETKGSSGSLAALLEKSTWFQVFGSYQRAGCLTKVIRRALDLDVSFGIASEAPCNMEGATWRRMAKDFYLKWIVPFQVKKTVTGAKFILNLSGENCRGLLALGWSEKKIIPFGYFPPPLKGTGFRRRTETHPDNFHILCTGGLTWHRGPDILISALTILHRSGVKFRATVTGDGSLLASLRLAAAEVHLPVSFVGFVGLKQLVGLYQTCDVMIAPGRREPWGIRVNDAVNCGAPVIVSRGMGVADIVDRHELGSTFTEVDPIELASKILEIISDRPYYERVCENLLRSRHELSPESAVKAIVWKMSALISDNAS